MTMKTMRLASIHLSSGSTAVTCSDSLSRSRTSLRSETASSAAGHSHHHHHHHHRRQASSTSSTSCLLVARQTRTDDDETPEEEAAGTTATCNTEDERHPESASTLYVENCHCSRGNLTTTTTTDDDEELQQYFINRSVSRRPSNVSSTSRVSHRSNRSTPRSGGGGGGGGGSGGSSRSRQQSKRATPLSGVSCCSHHSHHSTQPQTYRSRGGPDSPSFLQDMQLLHGGRERKLLLLNQRRKHPTDPGTDPIQTALEMRQKEHEWILKRPEQPAPPPPSRLQPLPLPPLPPPDGGSDYNDSQQDVNSINGSITSIIESTSSDQPGGSTTTSTTTSTTQRQLQHVGERGGTKNGSSSGSQMILTPSKITIENIGQLSEIAANDYDFDDIDVSIPEMFHSPSKIKWNFLAGLEENKSNKSRISSISSLVDAASSGRGRSGTESGGADVSETGSERRRDDSSDNDYSPNRIQHQPLPPLPTPPPQSSSSCKIEELLKKIIPFGFVRVQDGIDLARGK
ncbi:probable serine/threonine-protein kinase DDB_G0272282 [Culex quinquefasciatus]|uniref:probable serine/threonine-protein kinase DDB_G0272282 n=1 Tax=Culex quinquefasciatus TaxID=7176 RepID=UPI0018E31274|nr:probable serine/threonine-protein kinase DDB_G0272282 [Culex quinquefasciatus]